MLTSFAIAVGFLVVLIVVLLLWLCIAALFCAWLEGMDR